MNWNKGENNMKTNEIPNLNNGRHKIDIFALNCNMNPEHEMLINPQNINFEDMTIQEAQWLHNYCHITYELYDGLVDVIKNGKVIWSNNPEREVVLTENVLEKQDEKMNDTAPAMAMA